MAGEPLEKTEFPHLDVKEIVKSMSDPQTPLAEEAMMLQVKSHSLPSATMLATEWIKANLPNEEISQIEAVAADVFGSEDLGREWLSQPNLATFNLSPISLIGRAGGYKHVSTLLRRIEHGILA